MREFLIEGIKKIGTSYTEEKIDKLVKYYNLLIEYNLHTNLTAIRDEKEIIEKHFLDSLLLNELLEKDAKKAIDIGTGAGFPGMVLAIFNPSISFTLIDSVAKKTKFLSSVVEELGLENVVVVNARAEEFINEENRETYDIGLCRGVSKLSTILEYVIPFLKVGAYFLPQKQEGTKEEDESTNALKTLNCKIVKINEFKLPYSNDKRIIIEIIKEAETDLKYPRRVGLAQKRPL